MSKFCVILPAAGKSSRFNRSACALRDFDSPLLRKKQFANLIDSAVWVHAAQRFLDRKDVLQIIIAIADDDLVEFKHKFQSNLVIDNIEVAHGGVERADSIRNALKLVRQEIEFVAVHDAARPCVTDDMIERTFAKAKQTGAAMLACPVADTLKRVDDKGQIVETVPRAGLWAAQTPQVFRRDWLEKAYQLPDSSRATDDCMLIERLGHKVSVVESTMMNLKITTQEDLRIAAQLVSLNKKKSALDFF